MKILVTGGTGTLGKHVVPMLRAQGAEVVVLSRGDGDLTCDLMTQVPQIDADVVVHLAGGQKGDDVATRNLLAACSGVRHFVYISVIGADTVPLAWLRTKLVCEEAIAASGIPFTILRAAQFHNLTLTMVRAMAKLPIVPVPGMRLQPVDARDVAERIASLALGAPAGRVADLAGPAVYDMKQLVQDYLTTAGKRRLTVPVRLPGKAGKAYRGGQNLTLDGDHGTHTWEEFLAAS
ncbi:NmrA family transcriptional regulator [Lentzea aerocolonigenes]|uniref:NmrA family transcriptional regulator n=1 Tax=Lentzea aerocolonigenes TaxID=68170 RepID=A0A0F0GS48_LENAE|nr:SDR family oxidoreductase [Lentzea aerocolonigenes]KJK46324.1 NmrA family transcriptional regulator [Lentzea aerocolonigenes]